VELYLHSPNTPSWRGAQLKAQGQLYLFLNTVSLSHATMTQRVEDVDSDLLNQLINNAKQSKSFCLALGDRNATSDTVQLLIYIRGITEPFEVV
jgi:hypothetical protein